MSEAARTTATSLAHLWSRRVGHAYLLAGPPGAGQREAAQAAAAALLCPQAQGGEPCGACAACRQVEARTHPDLFVPEGHGIDTVRRVLAALPLRPQMGSRKVVLWFDIDRLTAQAANALLKSVEEPPPFVVFVFTTDHPTAVLSTLRSRCRIVPFRPRPREERARVLAKATGTSPLAAYWALRVNGDAAPSARAYLDEPACAAEVEALAQAAAALVHGGLVDALDAARRLAEWGEKAEAAAEVLIWLLHRDEAGHDPARRLGWTRALADFRRAWQANANRQLALEVFCGRCWAIARGGPWIGAMTGPGRPRAGVARGRDAWGGPVGR
ncbi:MAG TPA: hypothetical protein VIL40_00110 [Thermaerobacter sp.]